jgi:tetratricopeptide (TPR) repeat protein
MLKNTSDQLTEATREMLQRAGRCYAAAGWMGDAGRVFERAGDFRSAAAYYEQGQSWLFAGRCYACGGVWKDAARCFVRCNEWEEAAQCLEKAGEVVEAAWLWAHRLHRFQHARVLAERVKPAKDEERMAGELVLARCEVGLDRAGQAAGRLKGVVSELATFSVGWERQRLDEWALEVAQLLRRPDITAMIHAAAVAAKVPGAVDKWEAWAMEELGDASGIPGEKIEEEKIEAKKVRR